MSNGPDKDLRPMIISEIDQMLARISSGDEGDLADARDWLADLVMDGDPNVISTMLRGWSHEMSRGLNGEW